MYVCMYVYILYVYIYCRVYRGPVVHLATSYTKFYLRYNLEHTST